MTWIDYAACADTPDFHDLPVLDQLEVCAGCARWVRQECYREAKAHENRDDCFLTFGGIPAHQRRYLRHDFRVPLVPGHFDPTTNRDLDAKRLKALNNPQEPATDGDGFPVPRTWTAPPGVLVPCPSWGAIKRHHAAGEPPCDECRTFKRQYQLMKAAS
jgi:hypothetical protein